MERSCAAVGRAAGRQAYRGGGQGQRERQAAAID
jgi:hypothetical protein